MNGSLWGDILEMGMKAVQRISALIALSSNFADEKPLSPLGKRWILGLEHRDKRSPRAHVGTASIQQNLLDTRKFGTQLLMETFVDFSLMIDLGLPR
jgi:hypothetical protein